MISVVLPLGALIAGRGIGMLYREQLGDLKSKILESVYSIRDIQIFGAGNRKMNDVMLANNRVNKAALGLTLHRQTIASFPSFFIYLARILILVCAGYLASKGIDNPVDHCYFLCCNCFFILFFQPYLCGNKSFGSLWRCRTYF